MVMEIVSCSCNRGADGGGVCIGRVEGKRTAEKKLPVIGRLRKAYIRGHPGVPPKNIFFVDCLVEGIEITEEIRKTNGFLNCITGLKKGDNNGDSLYSTGYSFESNTTTGESKTASGKIIQKGEKGFIHHVGKRFRPHDGFKTLQQRGV